MRRSVVAVAALLAAVPARASWTSPFPVSNDPAVSETETDGGRNVVVGDGILAVVWSDTRDGNEEIYFRESVLGTWNPEVRLTTDPGRSVHPAIGRVNGEMRVVWQDDRTGHAEIRMKRKILGIWTADSCLTCDSFVSARPALDHTGEHLVWEETKDGNREIYYHRRFGDGTWEPEVRVSNDSSFSAHPTVASAHDVSGTPGLLVLVAWEDLRDGNHEIYSRSRDDLGWNAELRVSSDSAESRYPSAMVEWNTCSDAIGPVTEVAWQDDRDGNEEIYVAEGDMHFWQPSVRLTNSGTPSRVPSLSAAVDLLVGPFGATLCPRPALVWEEGKASGGSEILYRNLGSPDPAVPVSASGGTPLDPSLAMDHVFTGPDGVRTVEVVWTDTVSGNPEIYRAGDVVVLQATGVPEPSEVGDGPALEPGRPNPFRAVTRFALTLAAPGQARVRVLDAAGRQVRELHRGAVPAGRHELAWDGADARGVPVAAGTYFLVAETDGGRTVRTVTRLR